MLTDLKNNIPQDFDWQVYISLHPDLIAAGLNTEKLATLHYLMYGKQENRIYKIEIADNTQEPYKIIPETWNINSKNIMFFTPNAPDYDISGGGLRLLNILKIFKYDLLYNIYYFCNGTAHQKYIDILKDITTKVYMPDINKHIFLDKNIANLKQQNIIFDIAFFGWYDMGYQYIDIVKQYYPNIKIVVDSVDVHWIREQRGKNSNELTIPQQSLDYRKQLEKQVYRNAEVVIAISDHDKKIIESEIGYHNNIKVLGHINEDLEPITTPGDHIIFYGNYNHGPNATALKSCIEIFESFQKTQTYKNLKNPPKLLLAGTGFKDKINNPDIEYLGFVKDINQLLIQTAVLLAPISWGSGIKIKICETLNRSIPVITSDIGNEGIGLTNEVNGMIANSNQEYVNHLQKFFTLKKTQRQNIGKAGYNFIIQKYGKNIAINCLKHILQDKNIVISILTYNQPKNLEKCLTSILEKTEYRNYTIVISNNGDENPCYKIVQKIQKKYPNKIIYRKNTNNLFFIEGNNAIINDPQYKNSDILLLNDDTEIIDGYWLNHLYSTAYSSHSIGSVGAKTIYSNGKIAEAGAEIYNSGDGRNIGRGHDPNILQFNVRKPVGYCSGCVLYMKRDTINDIGALSQKLQKLYYEDAEWCYRSHGRGYTTVYEPRCKVIHYEGATNGTDLNSGYKKYQIINKKKFLKIMKNLNLNIEDYNG